MNYMMTSSYWELQVPISTHAAWPANHQMQSNTTHKKRGSRKKRGRKEKRPKTSHFCRQAASHDLYHFLGVYVPALGPKRPNGKTCWQVILQAFVTLLGMYVPVLSPKRPKGKTHSQVILQAFTPLFGHVRSHFKP